MRSLTFARSLSLIRGKPMGNLKDGRWVVTYLNLRGEFSYRFYKSPLSIIRWSAHMKKHRNWILVTIEKREWWRP